MSVREARPEDAPAIAQAHVLSWQAAYRGLMPDEYLDSLSIESRSEGWTRLLTSATSQQTVFVADEDGDVVGFSSVGPPQDAADAAPDGSVGELFTIYLRPEAWGRGLGRELLERAERELRDRGYGQAILWVVEGNDRTRRFYEAAGWSLDGGTKIECLPGTEAPAVRYRKSL